MSIKKLSLSGLVLLLTIGAVFSQGLLRNSVTTNAFPKVFPNANDVLIWDGVKQIWTNGTATVSATNAIADINGSSSNHQFIVIWAQAETSNTFGIQTLQGSTGGTNFFHFPTADTTHSGVLSSNDWTSFSNIALTNVDASQFAVASKILYFRVGAMATNLNANGLTNRGFTLLQGNMIAGTNGWTQWGDSINVQAFTNWNVVYQNGSWNMVVPGQLATFSGSAIIMQSNAVTVIGKDGSDSASPVILKFGTNAYLNAGNTDASADTHYTLANNLFGVHSNDIVRMRELTNAIGTIGAGASTIGNTVFVDPVNGNDTTGLRGRLDKPFLQITNAMAATQPGDTVFLWPGIYTITNTSVVVSNGVSLVGSGRGATILQNCISNTFADAQLAAGVVPRSGSRTANLTITNVWKDTKHQAAWGVIPVSNQDKVTNAVLDNVDMYGDYDCLYWGAFLTPSSFEVRNSYIEGKIDSFAVFTATVVTGKVYNTTINTYGPAVFGGGGGNAKGINIGNTGITIDFYDSSILCSGSTVENLGINNVAGNDGNIRLYGTYVRATGTGQKDIKGICTVDTASTFDYGRADVGQIMVTTNTLTVAGGTNAIYGQIGLYGGQTTSNALLFADASTNIHGITSLSGLVICCGGILSNTVTAGVGGSGLFNLDQFDVSGTRTNIKNGALLTNILFRGITEQNVTPSRAAVFNSAGVLTNAAGTPDGTKFLRDDNTYAVPPGSAGGGIIQFQTNNSIVNNGTNVNFFAIAPLFLFGTNNAASNKADLQFQVNTTGTGNNFAMQGAPTLSNTVTIVGTIGGQGPIIQMNGTNGNSYLAFTRPADWKPTNSLSFVITNPVVGQPLRIGSASYSGGVSTLGVTNDFTSYVATPTQVGTNLVFDGSISDTYEVFVASSGLTNFIMTNIQQLIKIEAWVTNGTTVNLMYDFYNLFTAGQYYDQTVIPVDTNGPTRITVWRTSRGTNVLVQSRTYSLIPGANITFTTNAVNGTVSVAGNAGGGGGGPFNTTQFDASGTVTNIKDGAVLTNMQFYGATTRNYGTNLMNWIWLTNQLFYAPLEYNGSNGVTALATTNMWDLTSQNTFRSVTNFVGTNLFFIITNVTKSASLISSFIGNGSYSNNVAILAQSGVNIKWMNWQTNGNYDLLIRPNATYTLQGFAERATNIIMWVSTDDSYVPFFAWTAGVSNLTATNLNVTAGQSTSNFFPAGPMFKLLAPAPSAFTNLNGTITTFTNAMAFNTPAHTLTNNGDATILIWRGFMLAGTNNLRVVYGSHIWDPGPFTNANTAFEAGMEVTKVAGPGGFTNQLVDAWIDFRNYGVLPVTNSVGGFRTNYNAWQTNGIATSNILQVASRATGAFSNNFLKVIYEPGPR